MAYLRAYFHWMCLYGGHRAAKRYARSEAAIARKQKAERLALKGQRL